MQTKDPRPQSRDGPDDIGPVLSKESGNSPLEASKDSEWFCTGCGARITITKTVGEAGHLRDCPRRESHYTGMTGRTGFQNGRLNKEGSA